MPNTYVDTGHGATITFGTSNYSFNWTSIDIGEETIPEIDRTHLATSGFRQYIPGDLTTPGEITVAFQWDSDAAAITLGVVQTITTSMPVPTGAVDGAYWAGSGFVKRVKRPSMTTDELVTGEMTIMFDGITGPTLTPTAES